jgi:hypothetical protein
MTGNDKLNLGEWLMSVLVTRRARKAMVLTFLADPGRTGPLPSDEHRDRDRQPDVGHVQAL